MKKPLGVYPMLFVALIVTIVFWMVVELCVLTIGQT